MKKYIDIHTHPFEEYYQDPLKVVNEWHNNNIDFMFVNGTNKEDCVELMKLCKKEKFLYPIIGIHPTESKGKSDGEFLKSIINKEVIGIGEIGLDYHYEDSPSKEIQMESFISQLNVALEYNLVPVLHIRDALEDAYNIITNDKYKKMNIVFHSYSGDVEFTKKCLSHDNLYFSLSGVVTFKNAKKIQDSLCLIPIDRIFCETDSPYLAPVPMRGKPNISPYVEYTYKYISNLKNIDETKLILQIRENIKKVFRI